jgi:HAE1 family hydrophobic/amphiphilic exporter-1
VTFALGTDPDINTVNVQNRASLAVPQLPQEVSRSGLTIRKKSAALLQVINLYSPNKTYDAVYLSNYATINLIDALARIKGVGQATLFGPLDYSLRVWLDPDRLTELSLTPNDVISSVQGQNIQAALGRVGAAPITREQQVQINIKTKGRCPRRNERKIARPLQSLQWRAGGRDRDLPDSGFQCDRRGASGSRDNERAGEAFPR